MIGWINLSVEAFICDSFGRDAWLQIIKQAHVDCNWVSSCPYPDKTTYDLVITGAAILGVTVPQALEAYGQYFVNYVIKQGYTRLMRSLGANIAEFLANLNNLHLHLTMGFPSMVAPAFRVEQVTSTSLLLHYHSIRPALWPIVSGVLKGASKVLFEHEVEMELIASRDAGDCDHEVFRVTYPHQESLVDWDDHGAALASSYSMTKDFFYEMFPFHLILDRECRLLQCGRVMGRLFGKTLTRGSAITDTFKLRHPYIPFEYDRMVLESDSLYLLKSLETGLEFKGQMVQTSMPDGLPVLLFLGSPRVANLEEMSVHGIYLSDIPLHDMSRDFVLLAEQRQAEADLKERFEKMAVDLRVANERLEQATRWLDEERQRSDALLYRMLPADIAADLREGHKVEAISYPEVTILFSDMVGFTTTSAKSTPEEVYNMLNAMYDIFDGIVDDFPDVYKLETIGDAYFLVCNLTTQCEKHVDTVIDFAIRMQASARKVKNAQGEPVQIRIGIHTGPVVGGVLGAKTPRFSIYGDTVNVASRMESHGLPGKIHISDAAYKRIVDKDKYAVRERGNIAVKGRGSMTTYLIGGTQDDWLLRHSSFDSQLDGSGQLRDGSFVVTASARSADSLAPSRNLIAMEAIKEGDEDRGPRTRFNDTARIPGGSSAASSTTLHPTPAHTGSTRNTNTGMNNNNNLTSVAITGGGSGGGSGGIREGNGRYGAAGLVTARASGAGGVPSGSAAAAAAVHSNSSIQALQVISAVRGSTENAPASLVGGATSGIEAFITPQAAAAAAAIAAAAAAAGSGGGGGSSGHGLAAAPPSLGSVGGGGGGGGSFREVLSGVLREGSIREVSLQPSGGSGHGSGLHRDTSFRTVYARGRCANPGSPLVSSSRAPLAAPSSLTGIQTGGGGGGGDLDPVNSSGSYPVLAETASSRGGGGNSPHAQPYEPSPLSRPEGSGGSGMGFGAQQAGLVMARSVTAKGSPLAPSSQSGLSATATVVAAPPTYAGGPPGSRMQQLQEEDRCRRGSAPGCAPPPSGGRSQGDEVTAPLSLIGSGAGARPIATATSPCVTDAAPAGTASKSKSLAKKLKSLFKI